MLKGEMGNQVTVKYEDIGVRDYKETWDYQETCFNSILASKRNGDAKEAAQGEAINRLIFVEHPHIYTLGRSGSDNNMLLDHIQLQAKDATFYRTDRGGDITYHGPGQIVGYPIFDLEQFGLTLKQYIYALEEAIINTVREYGIESARLDGATGVWLDKDIAGKTRKICAIGVKASRYVTMHGFAFNVNTNLDYFNYINPCGFTDKDVTSLSKELGSEQDFKQVKSVLKEKLKKVFNFDWKIV